MKKLISLFAALLVGAVAFGQISAANADGTDLSIDAGQQFEAAYTAGTDIGSFAPGATINATATMTDDLSWFALALQAVDTTTWVEDQSFRVGSTVQWPTYGAGITSANHNYIIDATQALSSALPANHIYFFGFSSGTGSSAYTMVTLAEVVSVETEAAAVASVFPNPADDVLNVSGDVEIINAAGQVIIAAEAGQVDVSSLAAGVYFAKVGAEVVTFIKK